MPGLLRSRWQGHGNFPGGEKGRSPCGCSGQQTERLKSPGRHSWKGNSLRTFPSSPVLCVHVCVGCGVYVRMCDVCGVEWIVCLCGVCRVRGWDVGINSSVNSQNSQMGVICFKLFWKGCLQKNKTTTTKPQKTKQK